jgi:hypothetical protein
MLKSPLHEGDDRPRGLRLHPPQGTPPRNAPLRNPKQALEIRAQLPEQSETSATKVHVPCGAKQHQSLWNEATYRQPDAQAADSPPTQKGSPL